MKKTPPPTYSFSHKLLRGTLAVAQVFSALSATLIGMAQLTLPEAIASLQPLIGLRRYFKRVKPAMLSKSASKLSRVVMPSSRQATTISASLKLSWPEGTSHKCNDFVKPVIHF